MRDVRLDRLTFDTLSIPFTTRFRHASADRGETSTAWVTATTSDGVVGCGEACPRPYVTGESLDSARAFFHRVEAAVRRHVGGVESLAAWARSHAGDVDANPAAWCAIELAVLDALARTAGRPIEALLGRPPLAGPYAYTAVVGDGEPDAIVRQVDRYVQMGFRDFKLKASGDLARDVAKLGPLVDRPEVRVRFDANNLWPDAGAAMRYLAQVPVPLFAVEEPVAAGDVAAMAKIARATGLAVVLDESAATAEAVRRLPAPPAPWIVNIRVSKMGGLMRSLAVVEAARASGVRIIVGAQVGETSLLTRAALTVAEAAGESLVAQEGAFGTWLLSRDVCDPPLMFGAGGLLHVGDHPRLTQPGFGVAPPSSGS